MLIADRRCLFSFFRFLQFFSDTVIFLATHSVLHSSINPFSFAVLRSDPQSQGDSCRFHACFSINEYTYRMTVNRSHLDEIWLLNQKT